MRRAWIEKRMKDAVRTQMHYARHGTTTEEMKFVADDEHLDAGFVRDEIARGKLIIPASIGHPHVRPTGIGMACRCKINANIGNSSVSSDIGCEIGKLRLAVKYGADAVMDLSTGSDIAGIRQAIIAESAVPIGTVPIYEAIEGVEEIEDLTADGLFDVIERHAMQGVDFVTVHCGILRDHIPLAARRMTGIVSRGGALMARWMQHSGKENPLYTDFDRLLGICRRYDMGLSLGDGLRPGSLADASDAAQFAELGTLGKLVRRAREADVQTMVEGPGHIPFNEIEMNVRRQIELCDGAPFYLLGPLVTDIAAGYDHITSAIGGTMAAYAGASMLCYVTPKEHLGLPRAEDVRAGVIAHKIAAHAADIARGRPGARIRDDALSRARYALDWEAQFELMLDPDRAREYWDEAKTAEGRRTRHSSVGGQAKDEGRKTDGPQATRHSSLGGQAKDERRVCSMCGPKFCAMKISREVAEEYKNKTLNNK